MVIANSDDPARAPDRQPGECDAVPRVELALAKSAAVLRIRHRHGGCRRTEQDCVTSEAVRIHMPYPFTAPMRLNRSYRRLHYAAAIIPPRLPRRQPSDCNRGTFTPLESYLCPIKAA